MKIVDVAWAGILATWGAFVMAVWFTVLVRVLQHYLSGPRADNGPRELPVAGGTTHPPVILDGYVVHYTDSHCEGL